MKIYCISIIYFISILEFSVFIVSLLTFLKIKQNKGKYYNILSLLIISLEHFEIEFTYLGRKIKYF